ncbi:MAG TPA: DUF4169 family protein, partial [Emcibacteraceae bacterium]|nr:DUF4169 family protein [Emcibacteraceae bacterium]
QACFSELGQRFDMAEILSLSKARKKKVRAVKETRASENRVKFGRTKAEKKLTEAKKAKREKDLSAHKRDD